MAPGNAPPDLQCVEHAPEFLMHSFSYRLHGRIVDDLFHHHRIEYRYVDRCILFIHYHIAGKEQSDLLFYLHRLMREMRIAGAEDHILLNIRTDLVLQCRLNVDRGQNVKPFFLQFLRHFVDRLFERERYFL